MTIRDWFHLIKIHARRTEGQTMAEYGVVLTVITIGIFAALGALALAITGKLNDVTSKLGGAIPVP
jgi:Flp pilus assembly pilin Flp